MTEIYIVVNPRGGTGKSVISHEILVPYLSIVHDRVTHFKLNCSESNFIHTHAQAYDYVVGGPNGIAVAYLLLDSLLSVDAAVIEIGSGSTFSEFLSPDKYLSDLQEIDLRPTIIIPTSDVDPKAVGVAEVLTHLKKLRAQIFHRLEIRVTFTPTRDRVPYYESLITTTREVAEQGHGTFSGSVPFFPGFNRSFSLSSSWKRILENPRPLIKNSLTGIRSLDTDTMEAEKAMACNQLFLSITEIPGQLEILKSAFYTVGERKSIFVPPRL